MIRLDSLTKVFAGTAVVDHLDLEVPDGAFLVLLGPSGCGKTTTLRMIAGLETPTSGSITLAGAPVFDGREVVPAGKRNLGLVFQSYALWPHMTVQRNVEWPLRVAKWPSADRRRRVAEVLEMLAIGELAGRYPSELSGGQQQRVAIARTLGPEPSLLLLDEPLSNLDAKLRAEMRVELQRLHRKVGTTTVYVTHDQTEAMALATHVAVLNLGRLEQLATPRTLVEQPATAFVARFVGSPPANVLTTTVGADGTAHFADVELPFQSPATGATIELAYDASRCRLDSQPASPGVPVTVLEVAPLAGHYLVTVEARNGVRLTCVVGADDTVPDPGDGTHLVVPDAPTAVFGGTKTSAA